MRRARVILAAAMGDQNAPIGRQVGVTRETSRLWRRRWRERREALLAAEVEGGEAALEAVVRGVLADEPRSGAPATFGPEHVCQIVALACEPPEASGRPITHWTPRELAAEAVQRGIVPGISPSSVGRFVKGSRAPAAPQPLLAHSDPGCPPGGAD
jgi:putative transposase